MELLLLVVAGVAAHLWNRVGKLERTQRLWIERLEAGLQTGTHHSPASAELMDDASPVMLTRQAQAFQPDRDRAESIESPFESANPDIKQPAADLDPEPILAPKADWGFSGFRASRISIDFEDIFGRKLPIWGGGVALAIAGFFLVRWSVENGLLNESVRVSLGFAFGLVLLAGAELAHSFDTRLADPRVRQALAGSGLATLYASFYLAGSHYGLIDGGAAFAGLAAVTALAIVLSFRFGVPAAVLGLVGGFAAPALSGATDPNLPMLATYLAMVTGGLVYTGRRQDRGWLGLAALAGSLGWGVVMLSAVPEGATAVLAVGGYLLLAGTMLPALMGNSQLGTIGRLAACVFATLQIAALVDISGYSMLAWGAYVLLAAAIAVLGWRHKRLREAGGIAAALSTCLIAAWPEPADGALVLIATAMALIFAGAPLMRAAFDEPAEIDWGQLAAYPLALAAALCIQLRIPLPDGQDIPLALATLALAAVPAAAVWIYQSRSRLPLAVWPMAAFASAIMLAALAGLLATPGWAAPLATASVAAAAFALRDYQRDIEGSMLLWGLALAGGVLQAMTADSVEFFRLVDGAGTWNLSLDTLRAAATGLPFALLTAWSLSRRAVWAAQLLAVMFAYGALAQSVPANWLPAMVAAGGLALAWRMRWRAAHSGALAISTLWALPALITWTVAGVEALVGNPMMDLEDADRAFLLRTLLPFGVAWAGSLVLSQRFLAQRRPAGWGIVGGVAIVLAHSLYKALFDIHDFQSFETWGMAERTIWQGVLAIAALACLLLRTSFVWQRPIGKGLAAVGLGHFFVFSFALHNPLWTAQAVGSAPIANLLLPAYITAIAMLIVLRGRQDAVPPKLRPATDAAIMLLVAMLSLSELRHAFSGTNLTTTAINQEEDLLRSLLAIALALAFLSWGAWQGLRSWRIGSLALMLMAVTKVFVFDAAGLEGLARIASFLALGVCLIGIGWFYSRQLQGARDAGLEDKPIDAG